MTELAITSAKSMRERGYASQGAATSWWTDLTMEMTPELIWPLSIGVFEQMRTQDAQVSSVLRAVTTPIIRTQWRLDGTGCRDEVTRAVANSLGLPIVDDDQEDASRAGIRGRGRFQWDDHLRLALLMLPFGHMFFEQVYYPPDGEGMYRLRKLGPRMPSTISKINVARDGGLVSIEQYGFAGDKAATVLPVNRLVAYVLDREGGNWLGRSILRSAYANWLLKTHALRTWSQTIDRNGLGIPVYTDGTDGNEGTMAAGQDLASRVRAGDDSGAAVPNGGSLDMKGVTGSLPDINQYVRYHDEQIARSSLGHFLNLGSQGGGQVGSYALGSTFADFFHLSLQAVAEMVRNTANAHIVEDLVDVNFGPTEPAPQIVFDEIGTRMTELDRIREVVGLTSDADLVKYLRSIPDQEAQSA
jgi:hypothetical protein